MSDFSPIEPKLGEDGLPVPNLPLLRKVLDHIDAHPDEWNQSYWGQSTTESSCGTAYCIAGHAVVLSGQHAVELSRDNWGPVMRVDGHEYMEDAQGFEVEAPSLTARNLLGLTDSEASQMFKAKNSRADVQRYAETIAARAGERL